MYQQGNGTKLQKTAVICLIINRETGKSVFGEN